MRFRNRISTSLRFLLGRSWQVLQTEPSANSTQSAVSFEPIRTKICRNANRVITNATPQTDVKPAFYVDDFSLAPIQPSFASWIGYQGEMTSSKKPIGNIAALMSKKSRLFARCTRLVSSKNSGRPRRLLEKSLVTGQNHERKGFERSLKRNQFSGGNRVFQHPAALEPVHSSDDRGSIGR